MSATLTRIARIAVVVGVVAAVAVAKSTTPHFAKTIHLFSFMSWFGTSVWISFFSGLIAFKTLKRHTFGRLQSRNFPIYFTYSCVLLTLCIGCALSERPLVGEIYKSIIERKDLQYLIGTLSMNLLNLYFLEPRTTALMWKRHAVEKKLNTGHEMGKLRPHDPNHPKNLLDN